MKTCLAQGYPFAFGLKLFQSFHNAKHKGVVPMPRPDESSSEDHGDHAMVAVGYSDRSKSTLIDNASVILQCCAFSYASSRGFLSIMSAPYGQFNSRHTPNSFNTSIEPVMVVPVVVGAVFG
ncbi:unnamed protein product [Rotaria sp. Silwood1]|nr:unnamed protein product [Rotaria sp. Silwood1]